MYYRKLNAHDLEEVRNLHEEWFPISYPDTFYQRIYKNNVIAIGCFVKLISSDPINRGERIEKEIILGTIMVKV